MPAQIDWGTQLMKTLISNLNDAIQVAYLGTIAELTPPTAKIQPTAIIKGKKQNIVSKVHFFTLPLEYVDTANDRSNPGKLNYKVGDNVGVIVLDVDNMYFNGGGTFKVDSGRRHSIDFSLVVGKIANASDFKGGG